jgi:hypothetical protein
MQNPIHEAGETARSIVNAFSSQPLALALILMNLGLMGLLYWSDVRGEKERTRSLELLYENRKYVTEMLARCNFALPKNDGK